MDIFGLICRLVQVAGSVLWLTVSSDYQFIRQHRLVDTNWNNWTG